MASGKSNAAIAEELVLTKRAVEKHVGAIFLKLGLPDEEVVSRRVAAVLLYLDRGRPALGGCAPPGDGGARAAPRRLCDAIARAPGRRWRAWLDRHAGRESSPSTTSRCSATRRGR